jgi:hypothetical protein
MRVKGGGDSHKLYFDAEVVCLVQLLFQGDAVFEGLQTLPGLIPGLIA